MYIIWPEDFDYSSRISKFDPQKQILQPISLQVNLGLPLQIVSGGRLYNYNLIITLVICKIK